MEKKKNIVSYAQKKQEMTQKQLSIESDKTNQEVAKLKSEIQRSNQEIQGYKIYKEVMDKNMVKLQDAITKLQTDKESILKQLSQKDANARKDSREIARLIKELKEEKDKRKKWEWEEQMLQERISKLEKENTSWKKEAKLDLATLNKERQEWEETLRTKVHEMKKENDELKSNVRKLNNEIEAKNEELFVFTEEVVKLAEEVEKAKKGKDNDDSDQVIVLQKQLQLSKKTVETISEINQQLERELETKDQDLQFCKQYIEELNSLVKEERNLFSNGTKSYISVGTSPVRVTENSKRKSLDVLQDKRKSLQALLAEEEELSLPKSFTSSSKLRPSSPAERIYAEQNNEKFAASSPIEIPVRPPSSKANRSSMPLEKSENLRDRLISDFQHEMDLMKADMLQVSHDMDKIFQRHSSHNEEEESVSPTRGKFVENSARDSAKKRVSRARRLNQLKEELKAESLFN